MNTGYALIVGAVIVAVVVAFGTRWSVSTLGTQTTSAIYRLDRWTGAITWCVPRTPPPSKLDCEVQ
jgi:hypothetical protein